MAKRKSAHTTDPNAIVNQAYNDQAGAEKNISVGPHLVALKSSATAYTTDASTARALPKKGCNLAIYNNAGTVGAITLGDDSTVVALAAGVCDAAGNVGIPCPPNDWSYISCFDRQWIKTTAATLMVFIIDDDSSVK